MNSTPFVGPPTPKATHNDMAKIVDTFDRSCDHWSEAGRREMDDFYALAYVDYRHLANAIDWKNWLESIQKRVGLRSLRLLDVACGSGKFPEALVSYAGIASASIRPIDYALLDPSRFSLSEAKQAFYKTPFDESSPGRTERMLQVRLGACVVKGCLQELGVHALTVHLCWHCVGV